MFDNTLFFCLGDYRDKKKRYDIYPVDSVAEAHRVAAATGFQVLLDEAHKFKEIADVEERMAAAVLSSIHLQFHGIENAVSCVRRSREAAEELKSHFMESDVREYFPKILDKPIDLGKPDRPILLSRRPCPWMLGYISRELQMENRVISKPTFLRSNRFHQSVWQVGSMPSLFLQTRENEQYDGIVTAVIHDGVLRKGYLNLSNYLDWMRDFVIPRLDEIDQRITSSLLFLETIPVGLQQDLLDSLSCNLKRAVDRVHWLREELLGNHARRSFFEPDIETERFRPKFVRLIDSLHSYSIRLLDESRRLCPNEQQLLI